MALDENKILEVLKNYNLTSEETEQFNRTKPDEFADEAALDKFITKMRRENAPKTAEKDAGDISFDELQVAWETVKDAKEGDELYTSKQALESKSEEIVKNFAEAENPAISMLIAPEMSEWLKINDSRTNISDLEKARNSKLANKLQAYYNQYDAENNIGDLTPDRLQKIDNAYIKISEQTKDFDPFEAEEDGKLKHPEFADIAECYAKMQIMGKDGKPINDEEKKQYQISMIKNAMLSAKRKMSLDPNVDPANIDMKRFKELMNETMEEDILIAVAGEEITRSQNKKAKFRDLLTKSKPKDTLEVKEENINMALGVRFQLTDGVERRISQKSGIRNRLALIKQKKKEFEEKHPEMAKTLKTVKNLAWNLGKGLAIGYVTGGIGIFAYGAIMGYKKIKEMNRRRKEENKKTGEKVGFFKWLKKNPKEMVSLGFSVVSVGLSAMGVAVDTNLGAFGNWTGINNMIQDISWLQSAKEFVGLENVSKATVMSAKMVNALGAMSHEGISAFAKRWNETKGEKGWKRVLKSTNASLGSILGAAGMFAGSALNGTTPEEQSHSSSAPNETTDWSKPRDWSANEYKPPLSFGENQEDIKIPLREGAEGDNQESQNDIVTEVKSFDDVFQGETKVNLERAVNAAPGTVLEHLKAQGIFSEDTKFMSSPKLMEEINKYYASHPEADPQVLADIVNNPENQAQFIHDMKASNDAIEARRLAEESKNTVNTPEEKVDSHPSKINMEGIEKLSFAEKIDPSAENVKIELPEQPRNEDFYARQEESVSGLKSDLKSALKNNDDLAQTVAEHNIKEFQAGNMTQAQTIEVTKLENYLLDKADGNTDGAIDNNELSKSDLSHVAKETKEILQSEQDLAELKAFAASENVINTPLTEKEVQFQDWQKDPESAQFNHANAEIVENMRHENEPMKHLSTLAKDGKISTSQHEMISGRIHNLIQEGHNIDEALKRTAKDFVNAETYAHAQEAPMPKAHINMDAKGEAEKISSDETKNEKENISIDNSVESRVEGLTLQDAESLGKGHLVIVGDKWGNRQFVGCDENGTPFRITAIKQNISEEFRKTMMESGEKVNEYKYIVDVSENSPLYNQLYPKDPSVSDEILRKQSEIAQETYARNIFGKIDGRTLIQDRDEELVNYNLQNGEVASDVMSHINSDVSNIINSEGNGTTSVLVNENTVEQTTPSTEETRAETKPLESSVATKTVNYDFIEAKNWEYDLGFIPPTEHFSEDLWREVESKTYVDPVTHKFVCGGTVADSENKAENSERISLDKLAKSHSIYQAISAKQAGGLALTENESKFMTGHQAALAEHNLKIDKDGNVVFDEEKFRNKLGLHDKESIKIFKQAQKGSDIKTHIGNNSEFVDPSWKWLKPDNGR